MTELRVLQRVILPGDDDLDVVPLYVDTDPERGARADGGPAGGAAGRGVASVGPPHSGVRFLEVPDGFFELFRSQLEGADEHLAPGPI